MTYTLPAELQDSYRTSSDYPEDLIPSGIATYRTRLSSYKKRLDDAERDLCLVPSEDDVGEIFEIPVIDLATGHGEARVKKRLHSPDKLTEWLGVTAAQVTSSSSARQLMARKRDPKCRFIYLYGEHSRDKLKTTRDSLCKIMSYHQIMPVYLDFMLVFGGQTDAKDPRFSGFREQMHLTNPAKGHAAPELGRSGRGFQLCYNLKAVNFKKKGNEDIKEDEWSIRDAAIYHQFDVEYGTTLWVVTKGGRDVLDRFSDLTGAIGRPEDRMYHDSPSCFRSTLVTHLLFCHWSTEDWRWYLVWLEEVVEQESGIAVNGVRGPGYAHKQYEPWDIQDLQQWQDEANAAVMALESNAKILRALHRFYTNLVARKDFPDALKLACEDSLHAFFSQLDEIVGDFDMQIARAKVLTNVISDRKELVLQHLQSQVSERTEQLNRNLEREAVVMRIITIVTLLYLPATFVSTFFGTDVVKYQDEDRSSTDHGSGSFSTLALKRWLQVTIPLTALTLLGAWLTYRFYNTPNDQSTSSGRLRRLAPGFLSLKIGPDTYETPQLETTAPCHRTGRWILLARQCFQSMHWPRDRPVGLPFHGGAVGKAG